MSDTTIKAGGTGLRSYEDYVASQKLRTPNQDLGKNDFLNLLAAQMQYQDPLEPSKDTDFIAQLAQFSSLEQVSTLNETMSMFQSYSLTGKFVYAEVRMEDGSVLPVAGVVEKIVTKDGTAWAQVGDYLVNVSAISEVIDADYALGANPLLQNSSLIGKYVTGKIETKVTDENGEEKTVVVDLSGYITRIAVDSKLGMVAYLDNDEAKVLSLSVIYDIRTTKPEEPPEEAGGQDDDTNPVDPEPNP